MLPNYAADHEVEAEIRARVVNLTPHAVRLLARGQDGSVILIAVLDAAERPARVTMAPGAALDVLPWVQGLQVRTCAIPGEVVGLPPRAMVGERVSDTIVAVAPDRPVRFYIVSNSVAQALRGQGRDDVFTVGTGPEDLERKDGQVWGTYALEQAPQ